MNAGVLSRGDLETAAMRLPLAVDLDGTLIVSDSLHEGLAGFFRSRIMAVPGLVLLLAGGKAAFKHRVAQAAPIDARLLPYNAALLEFLRAERAAGRRIGLFTAADQSIADAVAEHLDLFEVVQGSTAPVNLSGAAKAVAIEAAFGPAFAYAGDSVADAPIFARAGSVILAGPVDRLQARLPADTRVEARFPVPPARLATWGRALRLQHWTKNLLVFVPALLALPSAMVMLQTALLFVLLGVLASATYLVNDLLDLSNDRLHPHKRLRPLAAGTLRIADAAVAAGVLIVGSLLVSLVLPRQASLVLACYLAITLAYSLVLKQLAMVDVTVLAGLFTLRILAGALLLATPVSPWLLTFSMLFFLSLAVLKRYAEMERLVRSEGEAAIARGYSFRDVPILLATGLSSAMSAIVIFMLYLMNDQYPRAIYSHPAVLWGIMPVMLVWMLRLWHLAVHGRMSEDPVVFALQDRVSQALGAVVLGLLFVSRL